MKESMVLDEVAGLYRIVPLTVFRKTQKVTFDFVPIDLLPRIDAIDRVIHESNAFSPGPAEGIDRPWYMHPFQEDNLIVLDGTRHVEIYTKAHGKTEHFTVTPHEVRKNGELIHKGGAMLSWPSGVFHRVKSEDTGSAAVNLAVHLEGFDIRTNFSIYDLNPDTGEYRLIRHGYADQF